MRLTLLALFVLAACDDSPADTTDTADTTLDTMDTADTTDTTPDTMDTADTTDTTPDTTDTADTADTTPDTDTADTTDTTPDTTNTADTTDTADTTPDTTDTADTTLDTTDTADTTPNAAPRITTNPNSDADTGIPGDTFALSVTATDPDGDPLSYTWSQVSPTNPVGLFRGTGAQVEYVLPELASVTTVTLRVSITDGVNPAVTADLQLTATLPRFSTDIAPIFAICTGCHGGSGGLTLTSAQAYTNLVNVRGTHASCNTLDRVKPGVPDDSLLIRKLSGTSCGSRMPQGNPNYFQNNPELLTRIRAWISAGALND